LFGKMIILGVLNISAARKGNKGRSEEGESQEQRQIQTFKVVISPFKVAISPFKVSIVTGKVWDESRGVRRDELECSCSIVSVAVRFLPCTFVLVSVAVRLYRLLPCPFVLVSVAV
jgi:hypothetical protein